MKKCTLYVLVSLFLSLLLGASNADTIIEGGLSKGDHFYMGYYEQDCNLENGRELIEWIVLDVNTKEDTALAVSAKILETIPYHPYDGSYSVAWGDAAVRQWLNYQFKYSVFNFDEIDCLMPMNCSKVIDYVTLLDENQLSKKYKLVKDGSKFTEYARSHGLYVGKDNGKASMWVRCDKTDKKGHAKFAGAHGKVYWNNYAWGTDNGVRPAITVSISDLAACEKSDRMKNEPIVNYGVTNQKIATRSGPDTTFDEIHTYNLGVGFPVNVIRTKTTNGTNWVEIEFMYEGYKYRVWTGAKRVDRVRYGSIPNGDYSVIGSGTLEENVQGYYGPGFEYKVLYDSMPANQSIEIMASENGWYLVQYDGKNIMRAWVPESSVVLD